MKFKDNKKLPMIFIILGFVLTFFGSTFAYLGWRSSESQKTEIAVTIDRDFMCSIDGGGAIEDSEYQLIPTDCTNPDYAIKREVKLTSTIYKENYGILFDMWIDVKKLTSGLSNSENFKYALTTSSNSCTEGVISSGTFNGLTDNGKTEIMLSNTYESTTEDTYYLYIWLDKAQTSSETMNQQFSLSLNGSCTNDEDRIYGGKEYTIMFDSNGGNSITDTIVVTNGSVYGTLPTPTKSGSVFVGWNTEADGTGDTITSGAIVKIKKDTTLYAMWGPTDDATCPTITDYNGVYDGGKHSIAVTGGSGGTIKYSSDNINWSTTIPTITKVGTLTTYVMVEGDEEHTSVMCGSKTVNISTKEIIPIISASDKIYDGNANATCTIDFDGVVSGDTVIGTLGNCEFDNADAGTGKTVTGSSITILGTNVENYSLSNTSATTTANINKSNNSVNVIASQSWSPSFSTSSQTKDITAATDGQGMVSYAIQSQKSGSTDVSYFTLSDTSITMAENTPTGSYMVVIRATAAGNDNYNSGYKDITLTVTVGKKANPITVIASQSWSSMFSTSAQTKDITAATDAQGTVSYVIQSQKSGTTDVSYFTLSGTTVAMEASTPAGSYTLVIRATASGNDNYNSGYNDITLTVTVGKAENPISVTAKGGTYSGTALPLVTTSNVYGNVYYSTSTSLTSSNYSSSGSTTIPTGSCNNTSGNTYTVYWYTPGNTNYNSKSGTVESIKVTCQTYTISYDANGGNGIPVSQTKYYGITLTLSDVVPTRTNYTFEGWSTSSSATSATWTAGGSYSVNPSGNVILYAVWKAKVFEITFSPNGGVMGSTSFSTVGETVYETPLDGIYKLEVWGAQGGSANTINGGYGGYSIGKVELKSGNKLYVNVGGQGSAGVNEASHTSAGGYNGGGSGYVGTTAYYVAGGGGATHIATATGTLKSLSSNKTSILIVAGGGGGVSYNTDTYKTTAIGHGGGFKGVNASGTGTGGTGTASGGTQTGVGSSGDHKGGFGYGANGTASSRAGGGGGYYGGNSALYSGGGGSGYIGRCSSNTDRYMVCYNCTESTSAGTETTSTTNVSSSAKANYAKSGNGAAKITITSSTKNVTYASTYGTLPTPTRSNYTFVGWNTKQDGTGETITSETIVNLSDGIILYAVWKAKVFEITFNPNGGALEAALFTTVGETEYNVPSDGIYKLEVWGAQGGTANSYRGGYGGYSVGTVSLNANTNLFVNVGGKGTANLKTGGLGYINGGYNGGGQGTFAGDGSSYSATGGSGGGATHIATTSGLLSSLSSNTNSILIVAGGGGGAGVDSYEAYSFSYNGGDGGGMQGVVVSGENTTCSAGTQISGSSFGLGGNYATAIHGAAGGGGGYYGGFGGGVNAPGCGGSGYIGNSLLTSKAMYCYNCTTSDNTATKTISTTNVSAIPTSNYAKSGDGAAKISMLSTTKTVTNGSTYGTLPSPIKSGYIFKGWNTKADGTGTTITSSSTVNLSGNTTLYAIWEDGTVYLYNNGVWNTSLTGNLKGAGRMLEAGAGQTKSPSITKNTSNVKISMSAQSNGYTANGGWAYFETTIDLTNYKTLRFEGSFSSGSKAYRGVAVWSSSSGYIWDNMKASINDLSNGVGTVDISSLTGKHYIGFWLYNEGSYVTCNSLSLIRE